MGSLSITLFGNFQALLDGQPTGTFRTNKAQALLVYLVVERERAHRRESLYTLLWPGMPEKSARHNLRQVLYHLRQMFPDLSDGEDGEDEAAPLLLVDRQTVQLNPGASLEVDLHHFATLLADTQLHDHPGLATCTPCLKSLETAVALYRGDFLSDFYLDDSNAYEDWSQAIRESYRGKVLGALEDLAGVYLGSGAYDRSIQIAERQLGIDPLRESAHRGLMESLARNGRRRAALAHYDDFREALQAEMEIDPSPETQTLVAAIRANELEPLGSIPQARGEPPTAAEPISVVPEPTSEASRGKIRHNLPAQPTPFIGRETELASLDKLLANPDIRLVTIVGPGGMGKTRLALAWAERQLASMDGDPGNTVGHSYADGIFFVDLAPLNVPAQIVPAIVEALQIQIGGGDTDTPQEQLLAYLADKQMLFILDNFEHLIASSNLPPSGEDKGGPTFVAKILQTAPGVQVIATSRERLHLRQEQLYPVPGLEFPDRITPANVGNFAASLLFLGAARRIQPDFELKEDDLTHLTRICKLLEGMPLALELAAGWVELFPLDEIANEIERGLGFLETNLQDVPDRHRSIQAVFESTWEQLTPAEQDFWQKLSVFRGGFTREAARQVVTSGEGMGTTLRLLSRLVSKSLLQADPTRERFHAHELLRQYARERLEPSGELEAALAAHAGYFLGLIHQLEGEIKGGLKQKETLDAIEADFVNIQTAWKWALSHENLESIDRSLEALFWFCWFRGHHFEEFELYRRAEVRFTRNPERYSNMVWRRIAVRRWIRGNNNNLKELEQILAAARKYGNQDEIAFILLFLGQQQWGSKPSSALQYLQESQSIYHHLGDSFYEYWILGAIAWLYFFQGKVEKHIELIQKQLEMAQKNGDMLMAVDAQGVLGLVAEYAGRYQEAEKIFQEVLPVFREFGNRRHICEYTIHLGRLAFLRGEFKKAHRFAVEGQTMARTFNILLREMEAHSVFNMILNANEKYSQAVKHSEKAMGFIEFFGFIGLAYAMCGLNDFSAAWVHLLEALEKAALFKAIGWQVQCLPAAALVAASEDRLERAAELLALAYHHPAAATGWQDQFPLITRLRAELDHTLGSAAWKAAWERGKTLDLEETITALLKELN